MDAQINQILDEIRTLKNTIIELKSQIDDRPHKTYATKRKIEKVRCNGITGRGTPCQNGAVEGTDHCRMHGERPVKPEKPKKVPRKALKMKKIQPEHTHPLGVAPTGPCPLCQTHGDVLDPHLVSMGLVGDPILLARVLEQYEASLDPKSRDT